MIKMAKKILKILLIIVILFSATFVKHPVQAATTPINSAYLYKKSSYGNMLKYNGVEILTTFVVYAKDGVEYPAYCLDANMPGVGENGSYTVDTSKFLNDVMLWRVITNGYPYKTISELGCNTKEEAFTATKQAVYCTLYGREASWYTPIGEQGKRVVNAMATILRNAKSSTSVKPSSDIIIQSQENKWSIDSINKDYISQTFKVLSSSNSNNCQLSLTGNYPDGSKIVDTNNHTISTIASGGSFKVMMPIKSLKSSGEFKINVKATLATKPVLYGKAPNGNWQDYAITASIYEDATGDLTLNYKKNETKIIIQKQDSANRKPIAGVTFQILDSNKKVVYTDLVSDSKGRIEVNNIVPGKYYLEEIKTKEGYVKYDKQIECNLTFNQTLTVTVNNTKPSIVEEQTNNQQINVNKTDSEIRVDNQNASVNIQHNNKDVEISNSNSNKNEMNINNNTDIHNQNENTNIHNTNENVDIHNKNENTNIHNTNQNVGINNENENTNENHTNQNIDINNENKNTNENHTNQNIDINNENKNTNQNHKNQNVNINNQNENINEDNTNKNININNENKNINVNHTNENVNIHHTNENTNINNTNSNINIANENTNTNIDNTNRNVNVNNQNINSNIQNLNGIVKLPKTGM